MMVRFYNFLLFLLSPLIFYYIRKRKKKGKEDLEHFPERLGINTIAREKGKLIWFHAASVGETISIIPLMNHLCETSSSNILLTTGTVTSAKIIKDRLSKKISHQYVPIDKKKYVKNFLTYFKPDLAIWVESELWPNLITECHKTGCPMILLNARISDKKRLENFLYKIFVKSLIDKFDLILPQEEIDLARVKELGTKKIKFIGNLKYSAPPLPFDKDELDNLKKEIGKRKTFLAASTHPKEEEIIANCHQQLKQKYPDLLTIIVPRHPHRGEEITELLKNKYNIKRRSQKETISSETDIYIADTLGELGLFYSLCPITLIGGSLIPHGGHNPLEAMQLNSAVVSGKYFFNFKNMYQAILKAKSAIIVTNGRELEEQIDLLLKDKKLLNKIIKNATAFTHAKQNILEDTGKEIVKFLS